LVWILYCNLCCDFVGMVLLYLCYWICDSCSLQLLFWLLALVLWCLIDGLWFWDMVLCWTVLDRIVFQKFWVGGVWDSRKILGFSNSDLFFVLFFWCSRPLLNQNCNSKSGPKLILVNGIEWHWMCSCERKGWLLWLWHG